MQPPNTQDDRPFSLEEVTSVIEGMEKNKAPGENGVTSGILRYVHKLLPMLSTAIYNGCLRTGCFPRIWKRAKIIPIVKPDKATSDEVSKFRPITLLHMAAKVLEKLLINRVMHHVYSRNLMNCNQFGFTPQTNTIDALITLKNFVEENINDKLYVVCLLISLDVMLHGVPASSLL
mgnify:CR=1 FL=1